jgi:hypothetical protein
MGYDNTRCEGCGRDQHSDCFRQCRCGADYCHDDDYPNASCFNEQKTKYGLADPDHIESEKYADPDELWRCDACNPHRQDRVKQTQHIKALQEVVQEMKGKRGAAVVERALKVVQKHADRLKAKASEAEQKDVDQRRKKIEKRKREEQKEEEKKKRIAERTAKRQKRQQEASAPAAIIVESAKAE